MLRSHGRHDLVKSVHPMLLETRCADCVVPLRCRPSSNASWPPSSHSCYRFPSGFRNTFKRRPLLQTSSPASNERPKPNSMARVSFKTVSRCGFTPFGDLSKVCHWCATCHVGIQCKSKNFCVVSEVASVRAGLRQVIDVMAILAENSFRSSNGRLVSDRLMNPLFAAVGVCNVCVSFLFLAAKSSAGQMPSS